MSAPDTSPVTAIVVTRNSEHVIGDLLDSLPDGMAGVDWRLIVVDNASADRTLDLVRARRPDALLVQSGRNAGYAAAVNLGLREADPDGDLLLLNPDVRLSPGAVARLRASLGRPAPGGRVGIAVPLVADGRGELSPTLRHEPSIPRVMAETVLGSRLAGRLGLGETDLARSRYTGRTSADWASGCALMVSRACANACGELDESFFLYSEDTEYGLRALGRGFVTQLQPEARVTHLGGDSLADPELWALLVRNKARLYSRRHGSARALLFRLACAARELRFAATGHGPSRGVAAALLRRGWDRPPQADSQNSST